MIYKMHPEFNYSDATIHDEVENDMTLRIIMSLRLLRLVHMYETADALKSIFDKLGEYFYLQTYMFKNILSWILASTKFLLCVHYMAIGWIALDDFNHHVGTFGFTNNEHGTLYVESFYLILSSITTVGYGDLSAFTDDTESDKVQA